MTADPQPTAPDHDEDATNRGRSATTPVEGEDDAPDPGSPAG